MQEEAHTVPSMNMRVIIARGCCLLHTCATHNFFFILMNRTNESKKRRREHNSRTDPKEINFPSAIKSEDMLVG